jgi:5-formyltetrahydrofolate cyclo-ligase
MDKKELRKKAKLMREALDPAYRKDASERIAENLTATDAWKNARRILIYVSFGSEVDTRELIQRALDEGREVYCPHISALPEPKPPAPQIRDPQEMPARDTAALPVPDTYKLHGGIMHFYRIFSTSELAANRMGILEPEDSPERHLKEADSRCLLVMPGLAFDMQRNRIGFHGGFYDRYLNTFVPSGPDCGSEGTADSRKRLTSCALAFSKQIVRETISMAPYDRKPDFIVTENGIF